MAKSSILTKGKKKRALAFYKNNQLKEAMSLYAQICKIDRSDVEALSMLGMINAGMERYKDAEACFRRLVRLQPKSAECQYNLGRALELQDSYEESYKYYYLALEHSNHKMPQAFNNLGNMYKKDKLYGRAIQHYELALSIEPYNYKVHNNLGALLIELERFGDAEEHLRQAIFIEPGHAEAHYNLGILLKTGGDVENALKEYDHALQLDAHSVQSHWNMACALLSAGNFEKGWKEYEWRLAAGIVPHRNFTRPKWRGEPLAGKILYVHSERGLAIRFNLYAICL